MQRHALKAQGHLQRQPLWLLRRRGGAHAAAHAWRGAGGKMWLAMSHAGLPRANAAPGTPTNQCASACLPVLTRLRLALVEGVLQVGALLQQRLQQLPCSAGAVVCIRAVDGAVDAVAGSSLPPAARRQQELATDRGVGGAVGGGAAQPLQNGRGQAAQVATTS